MTKLKKIECVTQAGLRKLINKAAQGNPTAWSKERDITPQQTSAFLRNTQGAGEKLPGAFGLVPITVYVPADSDLIPAPLPSRSAAKKEPEPKPKKSKKDGKKRKKAKK